MGVHDVREDDLLHKLPRTEDGLPCAGNVIIQERLGKGGMGAVYLGRDTKLNVPVAVKVVPFHLVESNPDLVKRFQREAQTAAQIDHPNLMRVYTVDEDRGVHYLVLEFVDGESAAERLKREGPLPEADALEIAVAAGEALSAAHAEGIIHRDTKPANIMIRHKDGRVKVADLGLAKSFHEGGTQVSGLTATGQVMGTPAYMSPEQAKDASQVDPRTDVYSLGATLYALLTGHAPHEATQLLALLMKVVNEDPEGLKRMRPELSDETCDVVRRMMARRPMDRIATMAGAVAAMKEAREGLAVPSKGLARPQLAGARALTVPAAPTSTPGAPTDVAKTLEDVTPGELAGEARPTERTAPTVPVVLRTSAGKKLAIVVGIIAALGAAGGAAVYLRSQKVAAGEELTRAKRLAEEGRLEYSERRRRQIERLAAEAQKRAEEARGGEEERKPREAGAAKPRLPRRLEGRTGVVFLLVPLADREFYISRTEVTNAQYERYDAGHKKLRDKHSPGDDHPAVQVTWLDAKKFCDWLTRKEEKRCRLPTEEEWERAACGAEDAVFPWGATEKGISRRANLAGEEDGYEFAAPAGSFLEGRSWMGAVDMSGNVWELCDGWHGPEKRFRVVRGGSWSNGPGGLRCDSRERFPEGARSEAVGFRCILSAEDVRRTMEVE